MQAGIAFALASAVLFGASTPFAKLLLGSVDPWLMAGLLYIGAGLGLAVVHILRSALQLPAVEARLKRPDAPWLAAVILFGGVLGPLFLMLGLARTDAATASLLLNLEGLATMGIAWVVFRENVDRRLLLGAFAILAGAALLSWRGQASFQWSGSLIAGACLCWGIDNNLTRKLSSSDPVQIAMLKGLVAGAVNLALALWQGAVLPSSGTIAAVGSDARARTLTEPLQSAQGGLEARPGCMHHPFAGCCLQPRTSLIFRRSVTEMEFMIKVPSATADLCWANDRRQMGI